VHTLSAGEGDEEPKNSPLGFEETERSTNIAATTLPNRLLPMVQARAKETGYESIQTPEKLLKIGKIMIFERKKNYGVVR